MKSFFAEVFTFLGKQTKEVLNLSKKNTDHVIGFGQGVMPNASLPRRFHVVGHQVNQIHFLSEIDGIVRFVDLVCVASRRQQKRRISGINHTSKSRIEFFKSGNVFLNR